MMEFKFPRSGPNASGPAWARWFAAAVAALVASGSAALFSAGMPAAQTANQAATFVGSETCAGCHRSEAEAWRTSQHRHAMAHATDKTVLGDFSGTEFDYYGVKSRFFRRDGKFMVETDGPDGKPATYEIKYTFGLDPLQQYLVEFPDGRIQALSLAWDARPKDKGGQRWFHLYPDEHIRHDDVLHWTKLNQNWNFMCAECHSTGVRKNYDAEKDRFATTWTEISVGCEACHGQGSRHVGWARERQRWFSFGRIDDPTMGLVERFSERRDAAWSLEPGKDTATRSGVPRKLRAEVETCGLCHARRAGFSEAWVPGQWLSDTHRIALLTRGLYTAGGQMQDEVYNYGSFRQSKMFAAGVTCSDCHDPHSAKLRLTGDAVCGQCHSLDKFTAPEHNRHQGAAKPVTCVSCHMPERTYMVVDPRHDHSFRVPRPDLSVRLGTPNACNDCHKDKSAEWAAAAVEQWYGPERKGFQKYAAAFHAARTGQPDAAAQLAAVAADPETPAIARATALSDLGFHVTRAGIGLAQKGVADPDPMVRVGALDMLENLPVQPRWQVASPLLSDPVRGVRIRAASLLADMPASQLSPADRGRLARASDEYIAAQRFNADRPEARSALGTFYARRGQTAEAETEYKAALRLSPQFAPAWVNLADLYRQTGRNDDSEKTLRAGVETLPDNAAIRHALGLTLVRLKRNDAALAELRRATELEPANARYAYVYAVGLHSAGRSNDAIAVLKNSLARHPGDRDILTALITFSRDAGDAAAALEYAQRLARMAPDDRNLAALIEQLKVAAGVR